MSLGLDLLGGGVARIEQSDGERVVLLSDVAAPPGSTLEGALDGDTYQVKVRSCRLQGAQFRIDGRFVNLSRAQRQRIVVT